MTDEARRALPRLSFAGRPAPKLETAEQSFDVVDLSPEGMRIRANRPSARITIGQVMKAIIRFPADRTVEVEGRVLRVSGMEAAVQLDRGHERIATTSPAGPPSPTRTGLIW